MILVSWIRIRIRKKHADPDADPDPAWIHVKEEFETKSQKKRVQIALTVQKICEKVILDSVDTLKCIHGTFIFPSGKSRRTA